jgi:hypothetical protein
MNGGAMRRRKSLLDHPRTLNNESPHKMLRIITIVK